MIIATGIDLVDITRLAAAIDRHGDSFLERVYTERERTAAPASSPRRNEYFAGRWAVKEAVAKALGTGIGEHCALTDVETTTNAAGAPILTLHGAARETASRLGIARIHISISHEKTFAIAQAIAEGA